MALNVDSRNVRLAVIDRARIWTLLQPTSTNERMGKLVDLALSMTIVVAIVGFVLESMPSLARYQAIFTALEIATLVVFIPEYALRLWSCPADPRYAGRWGRVRWALSASALVDLVAIVPAVVSAGVIDLRVLRGLRLMRLFRLGRYSRGLTTFIKVLRESQDQLVIAMCMVFTMLLIASSVLHIVERNVQPDAFGSIPAAMWWGVATLTTVGYGDVRPMTDLGRVLASFIAILGIGTFAMPAGIIASAFERTLRSERETRGRCPECGALRDEHAMGSPGQGQPSIPAAPISDP